MMTMVRFGIVGVGQMGRNHLKVLHSGEVKGAVVTAVCDVAPASLQWVEDHYGQNIKRFNEVDEFLGSGLFDVLLIATPHYDHPGLAIKGFARDLHVLVEKPAGVYTKHVREMNEAAGRSGKQFGMMYNQRTNPLYQKLRDMILHGELGKIKRFNWIITDWYRPQSYYDSGSWRATWAHEGGGVLINQCPHNLDLMFWTLGMMPSRIRAFCQFGKHRNIEVEDDVTAYMEYENGASGVFVTTVGDAPGTNRLEVTGDYGKVVIEDERMTFWKLKTPESEFNETFKGVFGAPEHTKIDIEIEGTGEQHKGILQNFVDALTGEVPLLAPGEEGIYGLTLSNAMYLSTWLDDWVALPLDEDLFYKHFREKVNLGKK